MNKFFFANNHRIWLRKIDFYIIFPLVYLCTFRKCQSPHCQLNVCVKIFIITTPRRDIFAIYMFSIKKQKRNGWRSEWEEINTINRTQAYDRHVMDARRKVQIYFPYNHFAVWEIHTTATSICIWVTPNVNLI